ncbi:uncharacterized protein BX663DRAFT_541591 [Cokeromyces recurvatus]|uniref:uncharacterized protein n=1 Tax=Cokeromyces recurvatus TaxID=90255 RepID=UPI00221FE5D3|nr:uncharacterized protein BX663DRAFT_541591 [Cokeromyces recurvatus]KAI7904577.1 hypothetical protein BX663DRAFT_541591 [Cokeromyces recurvatus]
MQRIFGEEGKFGFMSNKISRRYKIFANGLKHKLKLDLQPIATSKEKEMLINISKCKNKDNIDDLLEEFYKDRNMDCMCKYIRLVFTNAAELWASKQLSYITHNESWFRTNVYSSVWDMIFFSDDKFISKRADCYSNTTKQFDNIDNQRVDFILHNINDNNDYISAEEKPGREGVKSDRQEGKILQIAIFQLWNHKIKSAKIMEQMETITCQWEGTKIDNLCNKVYIKQMLYYVHRSKLNAILEAKYRYEIEMMTFDSQDENDFLFRSESTEEIEAREKYKNNAKEMDQDLEKELLSELDGITLEEDIITSSDWKDFILEKMSKKRKR